MGDGSHPRLSARIGAGRDRRDSVPIEALAEVKADDRPDPIELLAEQDAGRLPSLVPIRHARMNVSAFTFYRGAAAIMASDLSRTPTTDLRTQLCGDAHLSNFGVFYGADRRLVFDLNDFDETCPGPFEWDLKRLVASVEIAGRNNGLAAREIRAATRATSKGYRRTMRRALSVSPLELHRHQIDVTHLTETEQLHKRSRREIERATSKDSLRALEKLTEEIDGQRRIVDRPPLIVALRDHADESVDEMRSMYARYAATLPPHRAAVLDRYRGVDVALKVVGVGSVGTRCMILLLESDNGSPLFLQFKEATASVLEPYVGGAGFENAGERVVRGQRLMQATGDVLLGWSHGVAQDGRSIDFYFRQLWDGKGSAAVDEMGPKRLKKYAAGCGGVLALAHARSGDPAMIAGYLGVRGDGSSGDDGGEIDDAFATFADRYAELNAVDHARHAAAIADGRLPAQVG